MKNNKHNYPNPNILESSVGGVVSSTGFTGLIPALPEDEDIASYNEIYSVPNKYRPL